MRCLNSSNSESNHSALTSAREHLNIKYISVFKSKISLGLKIPAYWSTGG